jgi:hypothetical protein
MHNDIQRIVDRLKKIDPYWWRWELLDVSSEIAIEVQRQLYEFTKNQHRSTIDSSDIC